MTSPKPTKPKAERVAIYALCDPSGRIRYIGKANDPAKRFAGHMRERRRRTPVYDWIDSLVRRGHRPEMHVIEWCAPEAWEDRERHWITELRLVVPLLNLADGGDQPKASPTANAANGARNAAARHPNIWRMTRAMGAHIVWARASTPRDVDRFVAILDTFNRARSFASRNGTLDAMEAACAAALT